MAENETAQDRYRLFSSIVFWVAVVLLAGGAYYCRLTFAEAAFGADVLTPEMSVIVEQLKAEEPQAEALLKKGHGLTPEALYEQLLRSSDPEVQASSALNLARVGSKLPLKELKRAAQDSGEKRLYRMAAILSLSVLKDEETNEVLASLARDEYITDLRRAAIAALSISGPQAKEVLKKLEESRRGYEVRNTSASAKERFSLFHQVYTRNRAVLLLQRQKFLYIFAPFVILIGTLGVAQPPLLLLLLPLILYPFGTKVGVFFLLTLLTIVGLEQEWFVNVALASGVTLVGIEYVETTPSSYAIQFLCVICLINLRLPLMSLAYRRKSALELLQDMSISPQSRKMAIDTFIRHGEELVGDLLELESTAEPEIKLALYEALGFVHDNRAHDRLVTALDDENPKLRAAAVYSLGSYKSPKLLKRLTAMTKDDDLNVRLNAIKAIGRYGSKPAKIILETLLKDENQETRDAAKEALS